jgi:hypothetical protein
MALQELTQLANRPATDVLLTALYTLAFEVLAEACAVLGVGRGPWRAVIHNAFHGNDLRTVSPECAKDTRNGTDFARLYWFIPQAVFQKLDTPLGQDAPNARKVINK